VLAPAPWVFLEANPEDVTPDACTAWRDLGVRTLSLGVQSFADDALRFLGRRHSARQARAAVDTARAAGFDTVSVDLIFGLPGQTGEAWRRELEAATAVAPGHLSCYQLTVHARTLRVNAARASCPVPETKRSLRVDAPRPHRATPPTSLNFAPARP
jgi:oxygen-independent coproporphyrinogen-3 oxidase